MGIIPEVRFGYTPDGVAAYSVREVPDGRRIYRMTETVFPNLRVVASPRMNVMGPSRILGWVVPRDDTTRATARAVRWSDRSAPDEVWAAALGCGEIEA